MPNHAQPPQITAKPCFTKADLMFRWTCSERTVRRWVRALGIASFRPKKAGKKYFYVAVVEAAEQRNLMPFLPQPQPAWLKR